MQRRHAALLVLAASTAFAQPTQLLPTTPAPIGFGSCVAIDGDTLVVGSPYDTFGAKTEEGSVSVRRWDGSEWREEAVLRIPQGSFIAGSHFGASVAISGDTVVVGAPDAAFSWDGARRGYAFTYRRAAGRWSWETIVGGSGRRFNSFGAAVAISGQTMIVSEPGDEPNGVTDCGSVFVFDRIGSDWTFRQTLLASARSSSDYFGNSLAISGDTIVVGMMRDDMIISYYPMQFIFDQGSARVFTRSAGEWTETAMLTDPEGGGDDNFGNSVAIDGDTILVGSFNDTNDSGFHAGSAHLFRRGSGTWTHATTILSPMPSYFSQFGNSVSLSGSTLLIGAANTDVSFENQGAAFVYVDGVSGPTPQATLLAPDGTYADFFGWATAISGDVAVVGARFDRVADVATGSAWVFTRSGTDWTTPWCPADFNRDGGIDGSDVSDFFDAWTAGDSSADVNFDGGVDGADLVRFFDLWVAGGC